MSFSSDLAVVLSLLGAVIVMFALNRPRMDAVALIAMTVLPLTGVVTMQEALAGLSDPGVVLVAALFVVGEGLVRTGVAQRLGDLLVRRAGQSEARLTALLMVTVAGIGSFMSSTGVVAIFIPAVLRIARTAGVAAGRLMMPLSMAALISGMMTLIATPPNLVVHSQLVRAGHEGFGFLAFLPFGLSVLLLAILYVNVAGRWLLPARPAEASGSPQPSLAQWIRDYGLAERERRLRLAPGSPWVGRCLAELDLRRTYGLNVIAIERPRRFSSAVIEPAAQTVLRAGDVLFVDARNPAAFDALLDGAQGLVQLPLEGRAFTETSQAVGMAEAMIPATSDLAGKTAIGARFRSRYNLSVIGLKRGTHPVKGDLLGEVLRVGDTLLVAGPWKAINRLPAHQQDLILLNVPVEVNDVVPAPQRAPYAVGVLALVVALMATGAVPNVLAALIGCLLLGLFRCIDMTAAYRSIQWQTLFLIVGMLPFSQALQNTGGVALAADALLGLVGGAGPAAVLAALFALTALFGLFISNTATAVLMAPVALSVASALEVSPYPFAMAVALAASTAFMTPVSSPVNALVVGPGGYTFRDFVRVGVPFSLAVWALCVLLIPRIFPFTA